MQTSLALKKAGQRVMDLSALSLTKKVQMYLLSGQHLLLLRVEAERLLLMMVESDPIMLLT